MFLLPVPVLASGASSSVYVRGVFTLPGMEQQSVIATAGFEQTNGELSWSARTEQMLVVQQGDVTLHLVVNGDTGDRTIIPGEALHVILGYQNTTPERMKDLDVRVFVESIVDGRSATGVTMIHWQRLEDALQGVSSTHVRVPFLRYTEKQIPLLTALPSQAEGQIDLTLQTVSSTREAKDIVIRVWAEAHVPRITSRLKPRMVTSPVIAMRYRSQPDLDVSVRYFSDEGIPFGSGPLPPISGSTTIYRMTWTLAPTFHSLNDVRVTTVLPAQVRWTGRSWGERGDVQFDPKTRELAWIIGRQDAQEPTLERSLEIALLPSVSDVGRFAVLTGETLVRAQDQVVKEDVEDRASPYTTDLEQDEGARSKGVVRASFLETPDR